MRYNGSDYSEWVWMTFSVTNERIISFRHSGLKTSLATIPFKCTLRKAAIIFSICFCSCLLLSWIEAAFVLLLRGMLKVIKYLIFHAATQGFQSNVGFEYTQKNKTIGYIVLQWTTCGMTPTWVLSFQVVVWFYDIWPRLKTTVNILKDKTNLRNVWSLCKL